MYIVGYGSNNGNVREQANQGKDGIYMILITTLLTNIHEIQVSSYMHRSSPFRIQRYMFSWTGVVENSFSTNMKLGNFTAAQARVAVKNK